jgi:hypothetical protein
MTQLPNLWFFLQIGAAMVFATVWAMSVGRGPFEGLVTRISKGVAGGLVPDPVAPPKAGRRHLRS